MNSDANQDRSPGLLRVGRFFGVPLYFAPSWVLIATLISITYASFIRDEVSGIGVAGSYAVGLGFAVALAACILAHELGHVAVSLALGKPVRRVVIMFLGGISEIDAEIERARDELLIALAGPAVSAALGAIMLAATGLTTPGSVLHVLVGLLAWSNLLLAVFNLLPGLPLDGGRVLRALVWGVGRSQRAGTSIAAWGGRLLAVAVAGGSIVLGQRVGDYTSGAIGVLLGLFIWNGATQSMRAAQVAGRLQSLHLLDLLRPGIMVRGDVSVAEALRRANASGARGIVVVDSADRPQAIVDEARVLLVTPQRQPWTPVAAVARALEPGLLLPAALHTDELLSAIRRTPASEYLVVHPDGSPAGILATGDLAGVLSAPRARPQPTGTSPASGGPLVPGPPLAGGRR